MSIIGREAEFGQKALSGRRKERPSVVVDLPKDLTAFFWQTGRFSKEGYFVFSKLTRGPRGRSGDLPGRNALPGGLFLAKLV